VWSGIRRCSCTGVPRYKLCTALCKQDREPVLEGYETNFAMSNELRREDENISDISPWISQSEAARLRGVSREAIYNLVKKNRLTTLKIGDKTLVNRIEVENYRPRLPGPKPKEKKRNEAGPTPLQTRRTPTAEEGESRSLRPGQRIKYLRDAELNDRNLADFISQSEAARIRRVARQTIADLIERGRLTSVTVADRTLVLRSEVEKFVAQPKLGRPPKKASSLITSKEKKPNKPAFGS
jgi:excisionase family DNA binding protein